MKKKKLFMSILFLISVGSYHIQASANEKEYIYESEGEVYRYTVIQSGDNYNFEFARTPENTIEQLKAGVHVLRSLYDDSSIELEKREGYIRERAKCSLFEGSFYNYTFCILPNEFSTEKEDLFRGYVIQLPNWKWMMTRIFLPIMMVFGLIFFFTKERSKP